MTEDHKNGGPDGRVDYLAHTADAMFRAYGRTLEETFTAAAHALCGLMWEPDEIAPVRSHPVEVTGRDLPQLLVAFLEEILFHLDAEGFLTREAAAVRIAVEGGHGKEDRHDEAGTDAAGSSSAQARHGEAVPNDEAVPHDEAGSDGAISRSLRTADAALVTTDASSYRLTAVLRGDLLEPAACRSSKQERTGESETGAGSDAAAEISTQVNDGGAQHGWSGSGSPQDVVPGNSRLPHDAAGESSLTPEHPSAITPSGESGTAPSALREGAPRYATRGDVKAVTYSQIRVERDPNNRLWMVQVVVDM